MSNHVDVLIINGVDFAPYVSESGISWKRNDLEASSAGRTTMDGLMHRARVAVKITLEVSCLPLRDSDAHRLLRAIYPEFVDVTYQDPMDGLVTRKMYSNNVAVNLKRVERDGRFLWDGLKFPLIMQ